ncbi:uncharacterized protein LOC129730338 [Wyeomyia smithii]|uniref:uncharacterized protein LOC129730338 n=1 Tax=Wyeomyia smithii TaxID=174621 RepID=UPI0024681CAE|nr:uncharacterized protein LOC129730338 [Wyeomyia smithii]
MEEAYNIHSDDGMIDDDSVEDGDTILLNDFSIFEYFEPYKISDDKEANISAHCLDDLDKEAIVLKTRTGNPKVTNRDRKGKGMEYTRKDGTVVPERRIRPACRCRLKCSEKYNVETRNLLLKHLLRLKLSGQNQFLANHITVTETKRPKIINSRRRYSRTYSLPAVNGTVKVCKYMFGATFDIGDQKIRGLARKTSCQMIASDDQRVNNRNRTPIDEDHVNFIKNHIRSFSAYSIHYSRDCSNRLYLSNDLNVQIMYEMYVGKCADFCLNTVSYNTSLDIQNDEFRV